MSIELSPECLTGVNQFPNTLDMQRHFFEVGIPSTCIAPPLNAALDELEREASRNEDTLKVGVDVQATLSVEEIILNVTANGQFRAELGKDPIFGRTHYTPWISITIQGVAVFQVTVKDEILSVKNTRMDVHGNRGKWYDDLVGIVFDGVLRENAETAIAIALDRFNGKRLEDLFYTIKGADKIKAKLIEQGISEDKVRELLEKVEVGMRITPEYVWLSARLLAPVV